jgi:hypothetical protein
MKETRYTLKSTEKKHQLKTREQYVIICPNAGVKVQYQPKNGQA